MRFALADNFYLQCPASLLPASFTMPFTCTAMAVSFTCNARIAMVLMSLLFYVSCSRWHCTVIEIRSLVLARDDVVVGACDVLWVFTVFVLRQKNIRTKVCIEEFNIHSNGFDVYSNSSMLCTFGAQSTTFFVV